MIEERREVVVVVGRGAGVHEGKSNRKQLVGGPSLLFLCTTNLSLTCSQYLQTGVFRASDFLNKLLFFCLSVPLTLHRDSG